MLEVGGRLAEASGFTSVVLRAHNNSLSNRTELDPRAAFEAAAAGLALARRVGQSGWIHAFAGNLGYVVPPDGRMGRRGGRAGGGARRLDRPARPDPARQQPGEPPCRARRADRRRARRAPAHRGRRARCRQPDLPPRVRGLGGHRGSVGSRRRASTCARWPASAREGAPAADGWAARLSLWLGDADGAEEEVGPVLGRPGARGRRRCAPPRDSRRDRGPAGRPHDRREPLPGRAARPARASPPGRRGVRGDRHGLRARASEPIVADAVAAARATLTGLHSAPLLALLDAALEHGPHLAPGAGAGAGAAAPRAGGVRSTSAAS